jgi:hypothetical protein
MGAALTTNERPNGMVDFELPVQIVMMNPNVEVIRALFDAVHLLVERGVDVNSPSGAITPLLAAIEARNVALMTYLEEHGAREKP